MNSSGKEQLIRKLVSVIESLTAKNSGSDIQLQWKENGTSLENRDTNQILFIGGWTPSVANQVLTNDEGEVGKPQLSKRQRKTPALKDQDFYGKSKTVRVNNSRKEDGTTKISLTMWQCIEAEQSNNVRNFGLRILHHNVQSLSNKKMRQQRCYRLIGCT